MLSVPPNPNRRRPPRAKRLLHWLLHALTILSLLLCLASAGVWVMTRDGVYWTNEKAMPSWVFANAITFFKITYTTSGSSFTPRSIVWPPVGIYYLQSENTWMLRAPWWVPAAIFTFLPISWFMWWSYARRRLVPGLCQKCGYDLRATPERCPECGTEVEHSRQQAVGSGQ